jgi:hypothetical protein
MAQAMTILKKEIAMKNIIAILLFASSAVYAQGAYVAPYVDRNGTLHQGYYRSAPDTQRSNNLNAEHNQYGGTNPFTGQRGTQRDEYSSPPVYNRSSPQYVPPVNQYPYGQPSGQQRQQRPRW